MKKTLNVIILIIIILMVSMQRYIVKAENEIPENPPITDPGKDENTITDPPITEPEKPIEEPMEPENPPTDPEEPEQPANEPIDTELTEPEHSSNQNSGNQGADTSIITPKSSNNNLARLHVEEMELEPDFNAYTTEYYLIVDLNVEELKITAIPEDSTATIYIYGNENLVEGENSISIVVTAEDGSQKTYKIFVTKTDDIEKANANLKSLQVKNFYMYPQFSPKIYKYNLTINEIVKELEVFAEPENENATVEIIGGKDLKEGSNTITIKVTAEDGITVKEYKINTFISEFNVEIEEENKQPALIAMGICLIMALIVGIQIIHQNKK